MAKQKGRPPKYGEKEAKVVRQMRDAGRTWKEIYRATGINYDQARKLIDPEYTGSWQKYRDGGNHPQKGLQSNYRVGGVSAAEHQAIKRRRLCMPKDTRDLTARMFGDPLPGRSALDRRAAQ